MGVTQRFLIYLSFNGSGFRGCQIQANNIITVQGCLEKALKCILKIGDHEECKTVVSSRTDAGVHALRTAFHVDVPVSKEERMDPISFNHFFIKNGLNIIVSDIVKVPDKFNARFSAVEKQYIYRIGVVKKEFKKFGHNLVFPQSESGRTYFLKHKFDFELAQEASDLLVGEKDFKNFKANTLRSASSTICNIKSFIIEESQPLMPNEDFLSSKYLFYHFRCVGNRFLYKMIRRMVSVVLAVSCERLQISDVTRLLEGPINIPLINSFNNIVPAHGLYLVDVVFNPEDLTITEEEKERKRLLLSDENNSKYLIPGSSGSSGNELIKKVNRK